MSDNSGDKADLTEGAVSGFVGPQACEDEASGSTESLGEANRQLRDVLESAQRRLKELTAELTKTNTLLKEESAERRRAEEALQESEERYRTIIQSIDDAYYEVDLAGNLTFFNDALCGILGYPRDQLKGMNNRQYMTPETAEVVFRTFNQVFMTGQPAEAFDWEVIRKDGEKRYLETSVSLARNTRGEPTGFRGIARDVTERRRIMREIEALNEVKEKFLSHLAHELITPVALVEASLEHLHKSGVPKPELERILERIRRGLDRLKDIQEIAHEIVNPFEYQAQSFRLDTVTLHILEDIRARSAHRLLTISPLLPTLSTDHVDPRVYEKVLTTLLKNAIENTPDEGQINVFVDQDPRGILVRVVDHGVGIPESDLQFVFRGFYHIQQNALYSTRKPFDFDAGGKGLELLRLKLLEQEGAFRLSFESKRCRHIPTTATRCVGRISLCPHVSSKKDCLESGGTSFFALFLKDPHSQSTADTKSQAP
jgi:PAS domain S-box-containing protein